MAPVDLTVVVVSYNVRPFLDHCLNSTFRAAGNLRLKVIVVDNASMDGSAGMIARRYPQVRLLVNDKNVGFAAANNQAFLRADGEAVLIMNPDVFIRENTLLVLFNRLRESPKIGAIGPCILQPDGRFEPRSMRGFPTPWAAFSHLSGLAALFPRSSLFSRYLPTYLDPHREQEIDSLSGCCMMVRRDLLKDLGGFDSDYFMYGEDLDLCWRIRKRGFKIVYTPAAQIVHFKGESTRSAPLEARQYHQKAMHLFVQKNLADRFSGPLHMLISLGFLLRAAQRKIGALNRRREDHSPEINSTIGYAEGTQEFQDLARLEQQLIDSELHTAHLATGEYSYDLILAFIQHLRRQRVEFSITPQEGVETEAPLLKFEVSTSSR